MIVITGPGRSGTSVIARLYQELGFDPGGIWHPEVNAGLEAPEVIAANTDIGVDLGMSFLRPRLAVPAAIAPASRLVPRHLRQAAYRMVARRRPPQLLDWTKFADTVDRYRDRLQSLAAVREVVKDPRFCWTLPVWAAAGAPIDHVVICLRDLSAMEASREAAGHSWFSADSLRNGLVYAVGLLMTCVHEYALPYSILRFPDFLEQPSEMFRRLTFPRSVTEADVAEALARVRRSDLVHHASGPGAGGSAERLPKERSA
jgi:hypothetical protein